MLEFLCKTLCPPLVCPTIHNSCSSYAVARIPTPELGPVRSIRNRNYKSGCSPNISEQHRAEQDQARGQRRGEGAGPRDASARRGGKASLKIGRSLKEQMNSKRGGALRNPYGLEAWNL